jgi:hypothetical protein
MANFRKVLCLAVMMLAGCSAWAQQITGSIRGTVTDPSGAVVQRAIVSAKQSETGFTRIATTGHAGEYVLLELPVGHYQLQVEAKTFQKYVQEGITLNVTETATVPVQLVVGSESAKIQVIADAQIIQSTVTALGKVVQEREILDLPLNSRNFTQLGTLQPGVVPLTPGLKEAGSSIRQGQSYAVNGQRPESNNFLIDGANNFNGVDGGSFSNLLWMRSLNSEFLLTTPLPNLAAASDLRPTSLRKSGTNNFHGALYEFLRNDAFDATRYFATTTEPLKQNQFGGTLAGRLSKIKHSSSCFTKASAIARSNSGLYSAFGETAAGDFRSCALHHGESFDGAGMCSNPDHQLLFLVPTPSPLPFNQLPPPFISTFSQGLLHLFPLPNTGLNVFTSTVTKHDDFNQGGVRIDHYLTPNDNLNFRYMINDGTRLDPLSPAGASVPGFPVSEEQRSQNFVAQESHTFSPRMIGTLRFSFLRNKFLFGERSGSDTPSSLGFNYDSSLNIAAGAPHLIVSSYTTVGAPITGPRRSFENAYDYSGSLSWVRGRHELRFGGGFQHQHINMLQGIATNGFLFSRLSRSTSLRLS